MRFKKPSRASPVRLGSYQQARERRRQRIAVAEVLGGAGAMGLAIGLAAAVSANGGAAGIGPVVHEAAVSTGLAQRNTPMPGAHYSGCDDARAAGVAPLYVGEPGYRPEMDGDGVACERYQAEWF